MASASRQPAVNVGTEVEIDGRVMRVTWVGKEVKLAGSDGTIVWRHSRTVARLLTEQKTQRKPAARKSRKPAAPLEAVARAAS